MAWLRKKIYQLDANSSVASTQVLPISASASGDAKKETVANLDTYLSQSTKTLTNKTIDADSNTISNIENDNIKAWAAIDAAKIADWSISSTEFQYLNWVTSAIQTQLDAKQATITWWASTIVSSDLTASRALVSNGSWKVAVSAITSTELWYVAWVTSAIQTQLDAKGDVTASSTTTFTNKTFDAEWTGNVLSNITNTHIKAAAAIALNKLAAATASRALVSDGSWFVTAATTTATEIWYVNWVTSAIQTQLNAKAPSTSPTFATSITGSYLTASEMLITDGSKNIISAPVATYPSLTELTYVKWVTSAIQTQLNAKQATLVSATNIKTVNWNSLLWSWDLVVSSSVSDWDKWDITVSSSGTVWEIDAWVIDIANLSATGTPSWTTYLRWDNTWATIAWGWDVSKVWTPVNNQIWVWTWDWTIEGTSWLTFDWTDFTVGGNLVLSGSNTPSFEFWLSNAAANIISYDAPNTSTQNVQLRLFRLTNTSWASTGITIHSADGTGGANGFLSAKSNSYMNTTAGNFGVGITTGLAKLHTQATTEQFRASYDASNYYSTTVGSTGWVTFDAVGAWALFTFSDDVRVTTAWTNTASVVTVWGSQTLTSKVLTSATITTGLTPTSNDWAALGTASLQFSDLFLASGAVLNFANGNVVATHSSWILTVGTGDLRVTTAWTDTASVVTVWGTQTLTSKTLTSPTIWWTPLVQVLRASGSWWIELENSSGTDVVIIWAWGGTGTSIVGTTNIASASADYHQLAWGTGTITDTATGSSTNININLVPKGTGRLQANGVNVPTISSTDTLTNKRVTRRLTTTNAPWATPTTNTDNVDIMKFTGLATAITSMTTNLSGTPVEGDKIEFIFLDNGTARAITRWASFAATTVPLPTTTVISTKLRVWFERGGSTRDCIAVA